MKSEKVFFFICEEQVMDSIHSIRNVQVVVATVVSSVQQVGGRR